MVANNVTDNQRITHILISSMGDELHKLAHGIFAPEKVVEKTFAQIKEKLSNHIKPAPTVIAARCTFNTSIQRPDEDINAFVARLKRLTEDCQCGDNV